MPGQTGKIPAAETTITGQETAEELAETRVTRIPTGNKVAIDSYNIISYLWNSKFRKC